MVNRPVSNQTSIKVDASMSVDSEVPGLSTRLAGSAYPDESQRLTHLRRLASRDLLAAFPPRGKAGSFKEGSDGKEDGT